MNDITQKLIAGEEVALTNVTLLTSSEFMGSWSTTPVKELKLKLRPWAQYPVACEFRFKKPRQRNYRGLVKTPSVGPIKLIVLEGTHESVTPSFMDPSTATLGADGQVLTTRSRYSGFDERWNTDAYEAVENSGLNVLFDGRWVKDLRKVG